MGYSMSLHISKGNHSITTLKHLEKIEKHNLRKFKNNDNKGYILELLKPEDVSLVESFKKNLDDKMKEAIIDYNSDKIPSRKIYGIDDYIQKIENGRRQQNLAVEMIVGVGDRQMWQQEPFKSDRNSINKVFEGYVKHLQEKIPNFTLVSATIHQDEDTPHLHIVGIPLTETKQRGIKIKISKGAVFTKEKLIDLQKDVREYFEKGINENYKLDEPFKFGEKQTGRNWDYTVAEYKKQKENFNITNEIKELQELKGTLDNDVKLFYDSLEFVKNPFDYNHTNKIEKLENVKKTYMEIDNKMNNIFLKTKEKAQFLEGKVDKIKLDDKTIEELEKNLTRKYKKELGDKIRGKFVDSDELKDFEKRVYEDYKKQIENKVVRQTTIKRELEKLELWREELQKEFKEQFENHKRNVENWNKQKELEQEKIEKEHNDKLKKIEEEKLSLENLKKYCRTHNLYELEEQQRFLDNMIKLKTKTINDMNKEINTLEIKSSHIKDKLAQYTQEDNQKIADLKEYKEKKEELIDNINTYRIELGIDKMKWQRRKKALDNINDSVKNKNIELENIDKDIAEKSKKLEDINKNITNKNIQLEDINNNITNKNIELKNVEKKLTEKDKEFEEKEQKLLEKYQKKIEQFDKEYNYYEEEYRYQSRIAERFIEIASKTISKGSNLSEDEAKKLIEDNIDDNFVFSYFYEVDLSKKNKKALNIKALLKDLNYTEPEPKDSVKNDYTSYYDNYNK
jgi:plasmid recombination enzyme